MQKVLERLNGMLELLNVCLKKRSAAIAGQPAAADEKFVANAAAADRIESLPAHIDDAKCPIKVLSLECGGPEETPMDVCLKKCSAAEDCNEAVPEWMGKAEAGVKAGKEIGRAHV